LRHLGVGNTIANQISYCNKIAKDPLKRPNNMSILNGLQNSGNSKGLGHLNMKKRHFEGI
jgi:hypothetical protein